MSENGSSAAVDSAVDLATDLGELVHIDPAHIRMSPQSMRMLTVVTGRTMEQLMQSDEPADRFQTMAFFELRRRHMHMDPGELWELAGRADIELGETAGDPFEIASAMVEPLSPATGESIPTQSTI